MFGEEEWPQWTKHDTLLAVAYERYLGYQTSDGHPIFWDQSDRVIAKVETYKSKSQEALDKYQNELNAKTERARKLNPNYNPPAGIIPYVVFEPVPGATLPTLAEWAESRKTQVPTSADADNMLKHEKYLADLDSDLPPSVVAEKYGVSKMDVIRHRRNPTPFVPDLEKAREAREKAAKSRASQTVTQR